MSGVPTIRECSGTFRGSPAHARISEMQILCVLPCQENENNLKWVANYRYLTLFSTITMDSHNPKILAPIPSQCTPYSQDCRSSEVFRTFPTHGTPEPRHRPLTHILHYCNNDFFICDVCFPRLTGGGFCVQSTRGHLTHRER